MRRGIEPSCRAASIIKYCLGRLGEVSDNILLSVCFSMGELPLDLFLASPYSGRKNSMVYTASFLF
jgi:hypothetical protein